MYFFGIRSRVLDRIHVNSCQKLAATTPVNVRMLATTNVHIRASVGATVDLASERTPRPVECATREGE